MRLPLALYSIYPLCCIAARVGILALKCSGAKSILKVYSSKNNVTNRKVTKVKQKVPFKKQTFKQKLKSSYL